MSKSIEFKFAVWQFKSLRGEFYLDLAQSMKAAPGVSIVKILERYAQRYSKEPVGFICAHWLNVFSHKGRFSEAAVGTIPQQDLALLSAAESAGDLMTGLTQLGNNVLGLTKVKSEVLQTLAASFFMVIILHIFIGIEAFMVLPKMESSMKGSVSLEKLGMTADILFGAAHFIQAWWWLWIATLVAIGSWLYWALPNYTGKARRWLDDHFLPFQMYRDFNGAAFIVGVASLSTLVGSQVVQFNEALSTIRARSQVRWLNWQIDMIQHNLKTNPNSKAEIFNTGITSKKMYYRILDIADYAEMSVMLSKVGGIIMEVAPIESKRRASSIRFVLLVSSLVVMVGIYGGTGDLIESFKSQIQMKLMMQ